MTIKICFINNLFYLFLAAKISSKKTCCLLKCYEIFFQEIVENVNVKSKNLHKNLTACLHRKKNQRI